MKIHTQFDPPEVKKEINLGKIITVPDQSYTPRQILEKYAEGSALPQMAQKKLMSGDAPDLRFMDVSELKDLGDEFKSEVNNYQNLLKDAEQKRIARAKLSSMATQNNKSDAGDIQTPNP